MGIIVVNISSIEELYRLQCCRGWSEGLGAAGVCGEEGNTSVMVTVWPSIQIHNTLKVIKLSAHVSHYLQQEGHCVLVYWLH